MALENAMHVNQYDLTEKQIRAGVILLRQLQEEEKEHFLKQEIDQKEYDIPSDII